MTAPIPPFPVAALAGIWLAGQRCTRHTHKDPAPCPACCYTDNGYCGCQCHETHGMSWAGQNPNCACTRSMGDSADCEMHAEVYRQRQVGCSCWAGWEMPDGTRVDPYCDAEEWHNREADHA